MFFFLYDLFFGENENEYITIKKNMKKQITLKRRFYSPTIYELSEQRNQLKPINRDTKTKK